MNNTNFLISTQICWFLFKPQNFPLLEQKLNPSDYKHYIRIIEETLFWRNLFLTNKKLNKITTTGNRTIITDIDYTIKKIKKYLQLTTPQILSISCDTQNPYLAHTLLDLHLKKRNSLFNFNQESLKLCIINSVRNNEPLLLQKLIDAKADYNCDNVSQSSPLTIAIKLKRHLLVEILLKSDAVSSENIQKSLLDIKIKEMPQFSDLIAKIKPIKRPKHHILTTNPLYRAIRTLNIESFYMLRDQGAVSTGLMRKEIQKQYRYFTNNPNKIAILEEMSCILDEDNEG